MPYQLIKFIKNRKYTEMFLDGNLYMNSLSYFWDKGFEEQRDVLEGIDFTFDQSEILPFHWQKVMKGDMMFRLDAYKYCNLLCFYRMDIAQSPSFDMNKTICLPPEEMKAFGKYAVIIKNPRELIKRFSNSVESGNLYIAGNVEYRPKSGLKAGEIPSIIWQSEKQHHVNPKLITSHRDCFTKDTFYAGQREWRICLFRNTNVATEHVQRIGDIRDIVEVVRTKDLKKHLCELHAPCNGGIVPKTNLPFEGNIRRHAFRDHLYSFDGGLGDLFMLS